jgi:hypothetical protein
MWEKYEKELIDASKQILSECATIIPANVQVLCETCIEQLFVYAILYLYLSFRQKNELCMSEIKRLIDYTWQRLNTGNWKDVRVEWRRVYSLLSIIHAIGMLKEDENSNLIVRCLFE